MSSVRASNEDLALRMLARNGIAVIWRLNIAAAERRERDWNTVGNLACVGLQLSGVAGHPRYG